MAKKGISGDMVLQIGLLGIAAFTTLMAVNLFYDSVEVSVYGDPYLATRTMTSYIDFADASPVPMKIFHEIPQDLMGNPGYGTVLYNPKSCEFKVNKYSQDYMSNIILNHAWSEITLEELMTVWAIREFNKKFKKAAYESVAKAASKAGNEVLSEAYWDKASRQAEKEATKKAKKAAEKRAKKAAKKAEVALARAQSKTATAKAAKEAAERAAMESLFEGSDEAVKAAAKRLAKAEAAEIAAEKAIQKAAEKAENAWIKKAESRMITKAAERAAARPNIGVRLLSGMKNSVKRSGKQWKAGYKLLQKATTKLKRRAAIEGGERATKSIIRGVANREAMEKVNIACKAIPFPGNIACFASTSAWFLLIYGMETWMTYLPIMHFIERSQDATNAINEGWASASCISKPEKVIITKPNCGSEAVLDYPDFDLSGSKLAALIKYVPFLEEIAEASFAIPFSKLTTEIKTYEGIETDEEICVDHHNYLLSTEAQGEFFGIDGEYINPKNAVGRIPYGACLLTGLSGAWFGFSQWGVGCTSMYGILYLSNWIDPEMGHATKLSLIGVAGVFGGPIGGAALYSAFMYNPHDSTTFFPYLSQSAGMIDTDNYYYMENPYLISVSKEYKDGEYVTEISKEL